MNPHLLSIAQALAARFPTLEIAAIEAQDGLSVVSEGEKLIYVYWEQDRFTVYTPTEAHGHADTEEETLQLAYGLLSGETRFTTEYRGDALARTWLEVRDGDFYTVIHQSSYLCPFDQDEWELWPGEKWKQIRKTIRLAHATDAPLIESIERIDDDPRLKEDEMLDWLEAGLGPPKPSMKWAVGKSSLFIHQAPLGWRRRNLKDESDWIDYLPPRSGLLFRSQNFFRKAEPEGLEVPRPVGPYFVGDREQVQEGDWTKWSWTVMFTDGVEEAMGILDLFALSETTPYALELLPSIQDSLSQCLFVPDEWNMTPTPQ